MPLTGQSFIGAARGSLGGAPIRALNPATGESLEPVYAAAGEAEVNRAVELAAEAFDVYAQADGKTRGRLLRRIADGLPGAPRLHYVLLAFADEARDVALSRVGRRLADRTPFLRGQLAFKLLHEPDEHAPLSLG